MKIIMAFIFVSIFAIIFVISKSIEHDGGQLIIPSPVSVVAEKVLLNVVSTDEIEFNNSFSKQHNELYFTRATPDFSRSSIWVAYSDSEGSKVQKVAISGIQDRYSTSDVHISPNGKQLFFAVEASNSAEKSQLYSAERKEIGWGNLEKIHLPEEQQSKDLYYPVTTEKGHIYFSQRNEDTSLDIYRAKKTQFGYAKPVKLPEFINTNKLEGDAFISPDESYLIFSRMHDDEGQGMSDLYISFNLSKANKNEMIWSPAINMSIYNTAYVEGSAFVTDDGKTLLFTSNRGADKPTEFNGKLDIYAAQFDLAYWQSLKDKKQK